jgi:hypothetical protein
MGIFERFSLCFSIVLVLFRGCHAEESGEISCYTPLNIDSFSALCPPTNYPISNDRGLNSIEVLYYALASTSLPDNTTYETGDNIVCATHKPGPNITVTLGADVGEGPLQAGASISFSLTLSGPDDGGK